MKSLVVMMAVLLAWASAPGRVINVPGEQPTIQQGLNAAAQGDTVMVQPGTYVSDYALLWPTVNGIKLLSAGDSSNTVISGTGNSNVIAFYGGGLIDTTTVIRGFRITHGGNVQYGGGIFMSQSSPIVELCVIDSNSVSDSSRGAGIYCTDSSRPVIRLSRISHNLHGGLCFANGSDGFVSDCRITDNSDTSSSYAGGVDCDSSDPTLQGLYIAGHYFGVNCYNEASPLLTGCTILNNHVGIQMYEAGGPRVRGCTLSFSHYGVQVYYAYLRCTFSGCVISNNDSLGIYVQNGSFFTLDSCVVTGNGADGMWVIGQGNTSDSISNCVFADNGGRGIRLYYTRPLISNCVLTSNDNSGLFCDFSAPLLRFCTICRNSAQNGGGICCDRGGSPVVDSSTICENYATGDGDGVYTTASSWPTFSHCNILKNGCGIYNNDNSQMLQAPNVWWGDSTGPWHPNYNPTGQGDSVSQFVYPLPYLTWGDTTGAPPIPPMDVDTPKVGGDSITLAWPPSTTGKLAGYRVYYDTDTSGFPYAETVDVGLDTTYTINQTTDAAVTYYITVTCYDSLEKESWYSKEIAATITGSVEEEQLPHIPKVAALYPASPNPFRATTVIRYALPHDAVVTLVVYDAAGRRVRTLARGWEKAGNHSVTWAGTDETGGLVSRGAYFCHLATSNGYSAVRKMLFR